MIKDIFGKSTFIKNVGEIYPVKVKDYDVFSEKYLTRQIEKWKNWESRIYSGQELLTFITLSKLIK